MSSLGAEKNGSNGRTTPWRFSVKPSNFGVKNLSHIDMKQFMTYHDHIPYITNIDTYLVQP